MSRSLSVVDFALKFLESQNLVFLPSLAPLVLLHLTYYYSSKSLQFSTDHKDKMCDFYFFIKILSVIFLPKVVR